MPGIPTLRWPVGPVSVGRQMPSTGADLLRARTLRRSTEDWTSRRSSRFHTLGSLKNQNGEASSWVAVFSNEWPETASEILPNHGVAGDMREILAAAIGPASPPKSMLALTYTTNYSLNLDGTPFHADWGAGDPEMHRSPEYRIYETTIDELSLVGVGTFPPTMTTRFEWLSRSEAVYLVGGPAQPTGATIMLISVHPPLSDNAGTALIRKANAWTNNLLVT